MFREMLRLAGTARTGSIPVWLGSSHTLQGTRLSQISMLCEYSQEEQHPRRVALILVLCGFYLLTALLPFFAIQRKA